MLLKRERIVNFFYSQMARIINWRYSRKKNQINISISNTLLALFDDDWYKKHSKYLDGDAFNHYMNGGWRLTDANSFFNREWYLARHPELIKLDTDPLIYYVLQGEKNGDMPSVLFDPSWYLRRYPDVALAELSPLSHFMQHGKEEGRFPLSPDPKIAALETLKNLFDEDWYITSNPEVKREDALAHYLKNGLRELSPNLYFDPKWYLSRHPELVNTDQNLFLHYILEGEVRGEMPSEQFDPLWYSSQYPDIVSSALGPLAHFIKNGKDEGRLPLRPNINIPNIETLTQLFDIDWYIKNYPSLKREDALAHYLNGGWRRRDPNPYFATEWYLINHPELVNLSSNPFYHYILEGEPYGDMPSEKFDPAWYRQNYSDVAEAGISPLLHYMANGEKEGRLPISPLHFQSAKQLLKFASTAPSKLTATSVTAILSISTLSSAADHIYNAPDFEIEGVRGVNFPTTVSVSTIYNSSIIAGTRYVISSTGKLLHDESAHFWNHPVTHEKYSGALRFREKIKIKVGVRPAMWIDTAINLMHEYENNYFHFIAEVIPKIILCQEATLDPIIPYAITNDLHPNLELLFSALTKGERSVIRLERGTLYNVAKIYCPSDCSVVVDAYEGGEFSRMSAIDVKRISKAVKIIKAVSSKSLAPQRIFACRHGRTRALINQSAVYNHLKRFGFVEVDTNQMSLSQQIEIFSSAEIVVGPTGAQLSNLVWCDSSAKALVLASDHPSHQLYLWSLLGRVSDMRVDFVLGSRFSRDVRTPYGVHDDYVIDLGSLNKSLLKLLDE